MWSCASNVRADLFGGLMLLATYVIVVYMLRHDAPIRALPDSKSVVAIFKYSWRANAILLALLTVTYALWRRTSPPHMDPPSRTPWLPW